MRRVLALVVGGVMLSATAVSCTGSSGDIVIGVVGPLSGPLAFVGEARRFEPTGEVASDVVAIGAPCAPTPLVLVSTADSGAERVGPPQPGGEPLQHQADGFDVPVGDQPVVLDHARRHLPQAGGELLGFYHSHPDHPARPSQYDLDHAWPFFSYVIVSVRGG